jgi:predicted nucleic acid-binding protein
MVKSMILIDTGVLAAFANLKDDNHLLSIKIMDEIVKKTYGTPIITDYVLDEVVTLLYVRTKSPEISLDIGTKIVKEKFGKFIKLSDKIVEQTWETYQTLVFKGLSFTDCSLLMFGKSLSCDTIATFDGGFKGLMNVIST